MLLSLSVPVVEAADVDMLEDGAAKELRELV
jgi:hypothetical protein